MGKRVVKKRKYVIHPGIDFTAAGLAIEAYIKVTNENSPNYLDALKERSRELKNWKEENSRAIKLHDAQYVLVYATPSSFVVKPIDIPIPIIFLTKEADK